MLLQRIVLCCIRLLQRACHCSRALLVRSTVCPRYTFITSDDPYNRPDNPSTWQAYVPVWYQDTRGDDANCCFRK